MDFIWMRRLLAIWLAVAMLTAWAGCSTDRGERSSRRPGRYPQRYERHDDHRYEKRNDGGRYERLRDTDQGTDRESHSGHDRGGHDIPSWMETE